MGDNKCGAGKGILADAAITCACGKARTHLVKLGWRATGAGDVIELARCEACLTALVIGTMTDASICGGCHRVISGETDDPKACVDRNSYAEVLCRACARRSHEIAGPQRMRHRTAGVGGEPR